MPRIKSLRAIHQKAYIPNIISIDKQLMHSVKNMLEVLEVVIGALHFILSFILLFFSARAYMRTKHLSLFYLTLGFAIITIGHLWFEIYLIYIGNIELERFDEIFDILGLIAIIIAVKKS